MFMVTGCTDGIGLAYARELARRGMNVVLISRSQEKLEAAARDIERDFQVETLVVQADFSKEGRDLYPRIAHHLEHLDVGILVNNVGVIPPYPLLTEEMGEEMIWEHVQCNVVAATLMTSLVLPAMKSRRRGAIVNLGSLAGAAPLPYFNVYSATKLYMAHLSRGLSAECQGSGVTIQTLLPSYVNTKMVRYSSILSSGGLLVPSAETYARHAVLTLGAASETAGYLPHDIQVTQKSGNGLGIEVMERIEYKLGSPLAYRSVFTSIWPKL
ncbi:hypothetical protein B566_EDAN004214 [Ephemera danica]|nr:hypothetical protein B566_EDAN004214 [Ephemera danica]